MRKTLNSVFRIRTRINNDNIKKYVKYYIENKDKLPWDLKNKQIGEWDVSRVTDMNRLFDSRYTFNEALNDWNVSNVTNMDRMFMNCHNFNSPLNNWNVSNVTNMYRMFMNCWDFNQALDRWNVSNVLDMSEMFKYCAEFNQPLNSWTINPEANTFEMFTSRRMLETNRPTIPLRVPTVTQEPIVTQGPIVDAQQIHKEATKIKYDKLNAFLSEKTGNPVIPNILNYPNYIKETINTFINEINESEKTTTEQRNGLQKIMNQRLNGFNYYNLDSDVKNSIFYSLNYVKPQSPIFKKTYVDTFIKDCQEAYEGANGMTCVKGAIERFVFSLIPACTAAQDNNDCSTIIPLITGLQDYILDWFKLHSPGYSTGSSSSSEEPFPSEPAKRKANLRQYLLKKLPGQEVMIDEAIKTWADHTEYDDDAFTYTNKGGRRRTKKARKTIKQRTMKRRINKRKTMKRRTTKRKTRKM
jgi:surface protein